MKDTQRALLLERITLNPNIMTGKPTIRNTRLTVEHILKALARGLSFEQLMQDFSFLEVEDIEASLFYHDIEVFKNLKIEPYFCKDNQIDVVYPYLEMYMDEFRNWITIGRPGVDGLEFRIKNNSPNLTVYVYYPIEGEIIEIADSPIVLVEAWKNNRIRL